ncbi:MAG: DUF7126 family protein [Halobacteriota archaeon]
MSHTVIVAGPDRHGLGEALEAEGATVARIDDVVSAETLEAAGIDAADAIAFTDTAEATGIAVAKDRHPDVQIVVYADESLPEFATAQTDLAIDPRLLDASIVAEELTQPVDE